MNNNEEQLKQLQKQKNYLSKQLEEVAGQLAKLDLLNLELTRQKKQAVEFFNFIRLLYEKAEESATIEQLYKNTVDALTSEMQLDGSAIIRVDTIDKRVDILTSSGIEVPVNQFEFEEEIQREKLEKPMLVNSETEPDYFQDLIIQELRFPFFVLYPLNIGEQSVISLFIGNKSEDILLKHKFSPETYNLLGAIAPMVILREENIEKTSEIIRKKEEKIDLLAEVLKTTPISVIVADGEGKISFANYSAQKLFGYDRREMTGKSLFEFIEKSERERTKRDITGTVNRKEIWTGEIPAENREGATLYVRLTAYLLEYGEDKKKSVIISFAEDVTRRKLYQETLEKYKNMVKSAHDVIFFKDLDGRYQIINDSTSNFFNLSSYEIIGKKDSELFNNPGETEKMMRDDWQVISTGKSVKTIDHLTSSSGEKRWFHVIKVPQFDSSGKIQGVVGIARDITRRKKVEELLKEKLEFERVISSVSSRFVGITDLDAAINSSLDDIGKLTGASRSYVFVFKQDGAHIDNIYEWCAPGVAPQIQNLQSLPSSKLNWWVEKLKTDGVIHIEDARKLPDQVGAEREILLQQDILSLLAVAISIRGGLAGFIGFGRVETTGEWGRNSLLLLQIVSQIIGNALERNEYEDRLINSRKKLRNLLEYLQKVREEERKRVAREIHDDLGQVMTSLKMNLKMIEKKIPDEREDLVSEIRKAADLVNSTIKSIQRICTELRPGVLDDLGLVSAIEWAVEEFEKNTGIECNLLMELKETNPDPDLSITIFRILQESLTNVARHSRATRAEIKLRKRRKHIKLEIRDNGIGIKPEEINSSRSLGIIGMRERVKSWGGEMKITGERNRGTVIAIKLPFLKR